MKHYYLKKEDFYIHLNIEDFTDANFTDTKEVYKDFKINI